MWRAVAHLIVPYVIFFLYTQGADLGAPDPVQEHYIVSCIKDLALNRKELADDFDEALSRGELSENYLCFTKCMIEKYGIIDEEGIIIMKKFSNNTYIMAMDKEKIEPITECVKNLGRVGSCMDAKKFGDCFEYVIPMVTV